MTELVLDEKKLEEFSGRVVQILSDACLALQLSVGHQTGLLDALAEFPNGGTSTEVAEAADLKERYVRECLNALVVGGIVDYEPKTKVYSIQPEHAHFLTERGGFDNFAKTMQFIPLLASIEEDLVRCFREGGGVPYSSYPRFQALMAEDSSAVHDATLVDGILPLVPGIIDRLTTGIDVCDIGSGKGRAANLIAKAFPKSRVTALEISEEGIEAGNAEAKQWGLTNATHAYRDAAELGEESAFDFITTFDAIHDQAHPAKVLEGIVKALRPGGTYLMVEPKASSNVEDNIDIPWAPFVYTASTFHCMTVSLAEGGDGLGTAWGEQLALQMLKEAGFTDVVVESIDGDFFNSYYVARKD